MHEMLLMQFSIAFLAAHQAFVVTYIKVVPPASYFNMTKKI